MNGRQDDICAFDTPKNPGQAIGWVTRVAADHVEIETRSPATVLHNGDGLCYHDLPKELVGLQTNRCEPVLSAIGRWRVFPKDSMAGFKDLKRGTEVNRNRNRDMDWLRTLEKKSSDRRIGVWVNLSETAGGFRLTLTDEDGTTASAQARHPKELAMDAAGNEASLREHLGRFGSTVFEALDVGLALEQPWFVPGSLLNPLRREAAQALEAARLAAYRRLGRARGWWSRPCPTPRTRSPTWPTSSTRRRTISTRATASRWSARPTKATRKKAR